MPARNQGAKRPHLIPPLANREVFPKGIVKRPVGNEQVIIHACAACFVTQRLHMRAHFLAVFVAYIFRSDLDAFLGFQIDERGRLAEIGSNFLGIENMK